MKSLVSPSQLLPVWSVLRHLPGGGRVLGRLVGELAPYTGTIRPEVLTLEPGHARVAMSDRRALRNHLRSVHAVALVNLAEATSGLAVITALPTGLRGIVTGLSIDYVKKARGRITAECRCPPIAAGPSRDLEVVVSLTDERADVVATAKVQWRVGPG